MTAWLIQHRDAFLLALRRLAATPLNTLLSLLAIGIALALPAGGQMLVANALQLASSAAPTPQISLFMALDASRTAAGEIETRLRNNAGIRNIRFVPREDTLARMKTAEGLGEVIEVLPKNPFPDAFVIDPKDERPQAMETLAQELRKLPRVEHVQLDSAWVRRLDAILKIGRTGVVLLAVLLGIGLVSITFNTIRLQVLTQRAEIEVSRLLGATDAYIRRPFHYFGTLLGLLGGAVAAAIVWAVVLWLRGPIDELAQLYSLDFALKPLGGIDSLLLLTLAAGLGWLGASLSLRQYLRDA
ncbi:MAG: permease-like cell division protein FtsX [Rhodocyclaceae bacterium]|jgi:cell division transport system permease protein|nr:permease-like cell division protein FtsX [Rhodocyclaceae bacterium]